MIHMTNSFIYPAKKFRLCLEGHEEQLEGEVIFYIWVLRDHIESILCGQHIRQVKRSGNYCRDPGMIKA